MYKYISGELKDRQMDASRVLYKLPTIPKEVSAYEEPVNLDELVADLTLQKLNEIFQSMMKKQEDKIDPIRSKFGKIQKEEISLEDCMTSVSDYARAHKRFSFRGLLAGAKSRTEIIVTFLAILELMKMGSIRITQEEIFDDIEITSQIAA
jgi:segregation and condensation protein A